MVWTALPTKTAGSSSISKAEMEQLMENIEYLRTRATFRVLSLIDSTITAADTWTDIDFDAADATVDRFTEWDTDGLMDTTLIGADIIVGDVFAGNWIIGGRMNLGRTALDGSLAFRWVKNSAEEIGRVTDNLKWSPVGWKVSHSTVQDFVATDYFKMQGLGHPSTSWTTSKYIKCRAVDVPYRPAVWGMWAGANTSNTDDYASIGWDVQANVAELWEDTRANLNRLYSRPACGLRASTTQAGIGLTWTTVNLGTTEFDTDAMAGTNKILSNRTAWYFVSAGVDASGATWTDVYGTALHIRLVRDLGGGGELILDQAANSPILYDNYDQDGPAVMMEGIIKVPAGSDITLQAEIMDNDPDDPNPSATLTLAGGGGTFLRMVEVSSDDSPANRQYFLNEGKLPAKINFTARDETIMPRGQVQAIHRDYVAALINPPVLSFELEDDAPLAGSGSNAALIWVDIPFNFVLHDNWDLYPDKVVPGSRIPLPLDGTYLVTLRGTILAQGDDYNQNLSRDKQLGKGFYGKRGLRILHNKRMVGIKQSDPLTGEILYWVGTCSALIVAKAGDTVGGQAMQCSDGDLSLASNASDGVRGDCRISAVWMGDGATWARRTSSVPSDS